ncbi:hypothetical protein GCM10023238_04220 [Streptomyces heliomycini]
MERVCLRSRAVRAPRLRAVLGGGKPAPEPRPLAEGVVEQDGEVVLARAARPDRDPVLPPCAPRRRPPRPDFPPPLTPYGAWRPPPARCPALLPAEAPNSSFTLLARGVPTIEFWGALEAEGLSACCCRDWSGCAPPAAARPCTFGPSTGTSSRPAVPPPRSPAGSAAPTCCWSPRCCTTFG